MSIMDSNPHHRILFLGTPTDKSYLQHLKGVVGTTSVSLLLETPSTFTELAAICKAKNCTAIISTSEQLLLKLVESVLLTSTSQGLGRKKPSIDNYAGSLFIVPKTSLQLVFIHPLEQLVTVSHGPFLARRYISKLTSPQTWIPTTHFNWSIANEQQDIQQMEQKLERFASKQTVAIATDIETYKEPYPTIRCVGYTAIYFDSSSNIFSSESLVIPCDSIYNLAWIRRFNAIEIPKIFQNGKYDISYLQAYNSAPWGYLWDTAEMMHSWYAELPKDLASLNSFFVRDSMYWKDLAQTNDLETYYLYNARDTWATANVFIAWIAEAPTWAKANYLNTFPLQYPCHLSEMTGIARDDIAMLEACREQEQVVAQQGAALGKMLATPNFNTNSPIQMKALLKILGCGDLPNADSKALAKAALRHPLNARIIGAIIASRKAKKLISTYLTKGKEFHGWNLAAPRPTSRRGRILYSLNPHGTDTGRLASKEHHFWCGLQIQNIPRGILVKRTLVADAEFLIAECDLRQAESRDTAFISGDNNLITAVTGDKDFHSLNASAFFGLSYDSIFETSSGKVLNKPIRQIAKNVNHGANYLMGAMVLIDTMGEDKVWQAGRLLNLPKLFSLKQIAEYLLAAFHRTYPGLAKHFYPGVIAEVITTHMLSSKAFHDAPTYSQAAPSSPLVRYCFGNPSKSKSDLNALVAHVPQSLNAMTLNRAYMRVFYEIAVNPSYSNHFKLLCQIHDSILFQFRIGHEYLIQMVADCMEIPVTVTAYDGITRTFTVPADIKAGSGGVGASRWSETE